MPLSELEARAFQTDMQVRVILLRLLAHKQEIAKELENEDISVLRGEQLRSALADINSQIQQYRFSGTF